MANKPSETVLSNILQQVGWNALDDARRLDALLRDGYSEHPSNKNVLMLGFHTGIVGKLAKLSGEDPRRALALHSKYLETSHGITPDLARWAIEAWADALLEWRRRGNAQPRVIFDPTLNRKCTRNEYCVATDVKEKRERLARACDELRKEVDNPVPSALTIQDMLNNSPELAEFVRQSSDLSSKVEIILTLSSFIAAATKPEANDEELCKLWESVPTLAQSRLAQQACGPLNTSPDQRYRQARRRMEMARSLKTLFAQLASKSGARIVEYDEQAIFAAYKDAEAKVGSLDRALGGELQRRSSAAQLRLALFAELHRLASMPPERDSELARWAGAPETKDFELDPVLTIRVRSAVENWSLVEKFLSLMRHTLVDECTLVAYADANPRLVTLPAANAQLVDGMPIPARVKIARDRVAALKAVREVIRSTVASGTKTEAGESAVYQVWQKSEKVLVSWEAARKEVEPRARLAAERLRRTQVLQQSFTDGDQAKALDAWGTDGALDDYLPAHSFKKFVEEAARIARGLAELKERLRYRDHDDLAVVKLASACGPFLKTSFATEPLRELNGQSMQQLVEFARMRSQFVDRLVRISSSPDPGGVLELAGAWVDEFDIDHSRISPHRVILEGALRERVRLENLIKAVDANQDEEIVRNWNDALFGNLPEIQGVATRIRFALKTYVERVAPFQPRGPGVTTRQSRSCALVAWDWLDAAVTHAYVLIGDKRAPSDHRNALESRFVSRAEHAMKSGIEFDFTGNYLVAVVRPVLVFRGERLEGRNSLVLREDGRRMLKYRVHGGSTGLGTRVLELEFDRTAATPELELIATDDGQPISAWGEQQTDENGRISIDLGGGLSLRRRSVKLRLKSPLDAEWVEIVHPTEKERRIAG